MRSRPVLLYVLMNIISAFVPKDQNGNSEAGGSLEEDPWKYIFYPLAQYSSNLDDDDSDEDSEEDSDDDSDLSSDSDDSVTHHETPVHHPQWAPARFRSRMIRRIYPQLRLDEHIQLCKRGATPGMIDRYSMHLCSLDGIIAWADDNTKIYLGWNIKLLPGDERKGRNFMRWVQDNMYDFPELWEHEKVGRYDIYRRVLPIWQNDEVLGPVDIEDSE